MDALEFTAVNGGFAMCLRNMHAAKQKGIDIDFSNWGEPAKILLDLDAKQLETLLALHSEFHGATISRKQHAAKTIDGKEIGRKKKELPDTFAETVKKWRNKECTREEAAATLGIALSTLYRRSKELGELPNTISPTKMITVALEWTAGKLSTKEASEQLKVTPRTFKRKMVDKGFTTKDTPCEFFRANKLFNEGVLSQRDAARLCRCSLENFERLREKMKEASPSQ